MHLLFCKMPITMDKDNRNTDINNIISNISYLPYGEYHGERILGVP